MKKETKKTSNKIVAWGMICSLGLAMLAGLEVLGEDMYSLAGLGMFGFGIWASVILLKEK
jgi:hypothetical protein